MKRRIIMKSVALLTAAAVLLGLWPVVGLQQAHAAQEPVVKIVAGSGGAGKNGVLKSEIAIVPRAVAINSQYVFISDQENHVIRRIDKSTELQTVVAGTGFPGYSGDGGLGDSAQLNRPSDIALDSSGNLYIVDLGNSVVRKLSVDGIITTVAGNGQHGYEGENMIATLTALSPTGIALDAQDNLYIAENSNYRVRKVNSQGLIHTVAGMGSTGPTANGGQATATRLLEPNDVAVDINGNLYISETYNWSVRKVDTSGIINVYAGSGAFGNSGNGGQATLAKMGVPSNLTIDASGNLYITTLSKVIRKVDGDTKVISTVAGVHNIGGYTADGEDAETALISNPGSVAVDGDKVYFTEGMDNYLIRVIEADGKLGTYAGNGTSRYSGDGNEALSAQLQAPNNIAYDSQGNLYISDSENNRIRKVDTTGGISTIAGTGISGYFGDGGPAAQAELSSPNGIAVDLNDNLYIVDTGNARIRKVDQNGMITTISGNGEFGFSGDGGPSTEAKIASPSAIAIDRAGNVLFVDSYNNRIRKIDTDSIITTFAGNGSYLEGADETDAKSGGIGSVNSLAVDEAGNVYFSTFEKVRRIGIDGKFHAFAGGGPGDAGDGGPATAATLISPQGIAVDSSGNVYIAERENHVIRKVDSAGIITTFAGTGASGYNGDGFAALDTRLYNPQGLTMTNAGGLAVADSGNSIVRVISLPVVNATVTPTEAEFDKNTAAQEDLSLTLTANGNTLNGISIDQSTLSAGIDYTVSGNQILVKKEFLSSLETGTYSLSLHMSAGVDPVVNVKIKNTTPKPVPMLELSDFTWSPGNSVGSTKATALPSIDSGHTLKFIVGAEGGETHPVAGMNAVEQAYVSTLTANEDIPVAADQHLFIAEVDGSGQIVAWADITVLAENIRQAPAMVPFLDPEAFLWSPGNTVGTTQTTALPSVGNGHTLKFIVGAAGDKAHPVAGTDAAAAGYVDTLSANGDIEVEAGQHLFIAEVDATGKIVAWTDVTVVAENIKQAAEAVPTLNANDFAWAPGNSVGSTQATALPSIDSGHTLKFIVGAEGGETHPVEGMNAVEQAYVSTLTANEDIPVAADQHLFIAEVDGSGLIVAWTDVTVLAENIRQAPAMVPFLDPEAFLWSPGNTVGTTQTTMLPSLGNGHTLKFIVGAAGDKAHPVAGTDAAAAGYVDSLSANGEIQVTAGQHLYIAEVDATGKIVAWTDVTVASENIKQAPEAVPPLNAIDFAWTPGSTVGTTQTTTLPSLGNGHTLKFIVGAEGDKTHPVAGTDAAAAGYVDSLSASSDIEVTAGQHLYIAEVDATGKIVAWIDVTVASENIKQAPGAVPPLNASDFALTPGSTVGTTQTTTLPSLGNGHTLKFIVGAEGDKTHPVAGTDAAAAGYVDTLSASSDIMVAAGQHLYIAEVDAGGKIVAWTDVKVAAENIKQAPGAVPPLNASDFAWKPGSTVGTTKTTTLPSVGNGHTLKFIVGATGYKTHPVAGSDAAAAGYVDTLSANGDIQVTAGQHLYIAEVDASGKIVAWADITVLAENIKQAPGAVPTLSASDFAWTPGSTVGTTKTTTLPSVGNGHTLKVIVGAAGDRTHPVAGTDAAAAGYVDTLSANGDIEVTTGQHLYIAEVDATGKIVAWTDVTVASENIKQASGAVPTLNASDFAWTPGNKTGTTKTTTLPSVGNGHTLKFIVGAEGDKTHPVAGTDAAAAGYVDTLSASSDIMVAAGQHLYIAEVDASGKIVAWADITVLAENIKQAPEAVPTLSASDFAWTPGSTVGTTQTTTLPSLGNGHTLKFIVGAEGDKTHPVAGTDAAAAGYVDSLSASSDIEVTAGQHLYIAEVDATGKIVAWTDVTVASENIKQAPGAVPPLNASDFTWAPGSTVGTTKTTTLPSVGNGHTLKVIVGSVGDKTHPVAGTDAAAVGYVDTLSANGDIEVTTGRHLYIAEVDATGKIVAWTDVTVALENIKQAPEAVPTLNANDFAWTPGSTTGTTQTTTLPSLGNGHTLKFIVGATGYKTHPVAGSDAAAAGYVDTLSANGDIQVTAGQHLYIAEVDASGKIVAWADITVLAENIKQAPEAVPTLSASDFAWTPGSTVGTTQTTTLPSLGNGHTLKFIVGAEGDKTHPVAGTDAAAAGYVDSLSASSDIEVTAGQHLYIAEVDASGKIVAWTDVTVASENIKQAPGAVPPLNASDFTWAPGSTVGTTKTTTLPSVGNGHTLKFIVGATGYKTHPVAGSDAAAAGYVDTLSANGDIQVTAGQHLYIAEVDASGKIVAWADITVLAENIKQAPEAVPTLSASDFAWTPGSTVGTTKTTTLPSVGNGHTLKVIVGAAGDRTHPIAGSDAAAAGYVDSLSANGDIQVTAGQHLYIAEVDASGKIVAWADITVLAENIKQAPGAVPTLSASDFAWTPGSTVGTTKTTTLPSVGNGHTLKVIVGAAGDRTHPVAGTDAAAAGYVDSLSANGDIQVTAGQHLYIAEVGASGKIVAWTDVAVSAANVREASVPSIPAEVQQTEPGTTVLINGSPQNGVAKANVTTIGSKKSTVVQLDPAKSEALLASKPNGYVLTIPVQNGSGIVTGELNAQLIRNMADKEAVLEIRSAGIGYRLPASRIDVGSLASHFAAGTSLSDIVVRVKIEMLEAVPATSVGDVQFISPAVEFTITATVADQGTVVDRFNGYVERTIVLPDGIDPNRITTGVVVGEDGSIRHVPTKVIVEDGRYVAKINSLTNSVYAVVWHPLTFADAENHWAKGAINDLGSRLVVNGVSDTIFAPNADMTRAEFAAIIVRGLGLRLGEGTASYLDVSSDAWYAGAVRTASAYGLVSGYPDGTFKPDEKLTREQAMVVIAKAMRLTGLFTLTEDADTTGTLGAFADAGQAGAWALDGIAGTVKAGLVIGQGGKLMPKDNVSRAEVTTLIQRLLQKSGLI